MVNRVHQVVFSENGSTALTGYARQAAHSVQKVFAGHEYRCWSLQDAAEFIDDNFPSRVREAFDRLRPFAYKADLFKYCLLRVLGGWYVDIGVTMFTNPLDRQSTGGDPEFVFFRSTGPWDTLWSCSVALMYARPGHAVFDTAIDTVVSHCEQRHYGSNPLMPTMAPLGAAIARHQVHEGVLIGNVVDVKWRNYLRGYQLKPGKLVAKRKPRWAKAGNIEAIGIAGSNNYVDLWRRHAVYGETPGSA